MDKQNLRDADIVRAIGVNAALIAALLWPLLWFAVLVLIVFAVFTFAR